MVINFRWFLWSPSLITREHHDSTLRKGTFSFIWNELELKEGGSARPEAELWWGCHAKRAGVSYRSNKLCNDRIFNVGAEFKLLRE